MINFPGNNIQHLPCSQLGEPVGTFLVLDNVIVLRKKGQKDEKRR